MTLEEIQNAIEGMLAVQKELQNSQLRFTESLTSLKEEWRKDRKQMFEWMSRLSASQANFWEAQADYYRRLEDVEDRQATMLEILNRLTDRREN
ncbi:hypothetical protein NIES593_07395 [Hydrococcus rivularis NIES-593]|uniref:Uncharacterized protein n=1 Tax=Hydrococcus rivularis NIES-593 TaxID=1921803 RepID=A0A1U7HLM6_9CYAN|nr:hypothetical protein [Hydrococcus rivularis]OKH24492.1 hypothetical protein NIES593_07395 [Hydrococcus rivularis NIES-593]